jgi:hypothetical protein
VQSHTTSQAPDRADILKIGASATACSASGASFMAGDAGRFVA